MGIKKWLGDVLGKVVANLITAAIILVVLFFGMSLIMKWIGI